MNIMKKTISVILTCLIILSGVLLLPQPVSAAQDVELATYYTSESRITSGSEFDMNLTIQNLSADNITNVKVIVDGSSSFSIKNSGSIPEISSINAGSQSITSGRFVYDGGSNKLQVTIQYRKNGNYYQQDDSITISQAVPKDDSPSTPIDTSKYAPKLVIASNTTIPSGQVGSQITYTLPLKNTSLYAARNIVVSPVLDDSGPVVVETMNISQTIESMQPNETKEVKFTFKISSGAAVKTYPIRFNIQYYNYSNDFFSSNETGYLKTTEGSKLPKLLLKSVTTNPSPVRAGENFKLNITLENGGTVSAKKVELTLLGLKNDGASIIGSTNKQTKSTIYGGGTSVFTYDLAASSKIESGSNSLRVKLDYTDTSGSTFSDEIEFFYNVQSGNASQSVIELKNIVSPGSTLIPGSNALIACDVANTGSADAYNVKVTLTTDKEIIPRTLNTIIIPTLKKGETKNVQFQLFVSDDAVTKNYPVALNVEYDLTASGNGSKQTAMQYVGFYVENKTGKSVPRLIIDKYSVDPGTINAGQQFTLDLSILNTSKTSTISNVKVSLVSDDGTFSTVNSNSFYIDQIAPKSRVSKQVTFTSKSDAAPKQYTISVNYEYEDEKGNPYNTKDVVGIPLLQAPRLVLGDMSIPPEAFVGNPIPVNVSFFNMGKSTLYNLMVKLEGNFRIEGTSYFVGNFESGKSDSFDGALVPETVGPVTGFVIFTYEDADGKPQELKKEITLNAMEMPAPQPMPGEGVMPPAEGGFKIPLWAYIASGVVTLAVIVMAVLLIRRKIKKRKELMLDEEL